VVKLDLKGNRVRLEVNQPPRPWNAHRPAIPKRPITRAINAAAPAEPSSAASPSPTTNIDGVRACAST
jgi:hypothetical protein